MTNLFSTLALLCDELAATGSRLRKRAAIAEYLRSLEVPGEVPGEVSGEVSGEAPAEAPAEVSGEVSGEVFGEVSGEAPAEVFGEASAPELSGLGVDQPRDKTDAGLAALYLTGAPFPETDPRKLNVGGALLLKVIRALTDASDAALKTAFRKHGDMGAAASDLLGSKARHSPSLSPEQGPEPDPQPDPEPNPTLTLGEISASLSHIASISNARAREAAVLALLQRGTPVEVKYLVKLMLGDMRIGVKQSLVEEAIAAATGQDVAAVRHAAMLRGDLAEVAAMAFADELHAAKMRLFHSLGFMLASPVETPKDVVARFASAEEAVPADPDGTATARIQAFLEDKYDGMRAQLHCGDPSQPGRVSIFSRNREDVTHSFPEIAEAFGHVGQPLILDGEILAWDAAKARALPFAVLGQRLGRKRVTDTIRTETPVVFMAFDLLYAHGNLQLETPLRERRMLLEQIAEKLLPQAVAPFKSAPARIQPTLFAEESAPEAALQRLRLSPSRLVESAEDIDLAYAAARERGNEGVMIKAAESIYQPGRRGIAWVKLKRELATLDVVVTAAEFGHGRRASVLSDYTFAVRDGEELVNVGKAYSGLTDAEIESLTSWFKEHTLEDHGSIRDVEPGIILEVAFNNVMRSARHASGFALRFPRILRIRADKPLGEIDTLERVEEIYQSQPDKPSE